MTRAVRVVQLHEPRKLMRLRGRTLTVVGKRIVVLNREKDFVRPTCRTKLSRSRPICRFLLQRILQVQSGQNFVASSKSEPLKSLHRMSKCQVAHFASFRSARLWRTCRYVAAAVWSRTAYLQFSFTLRKVPIGLTVYHTVTKGPVFHSLPSSNERHTGPVRPTDWRSKLG